MASSIRIHIHVKGRNEARILWYYYITVLVVLPISQDILLAFNHIHTGTLRRISLPKQAIFNGFDLESDMLGLDTAHCQVSHHAPDTFWAEFLEAAADLALVVQPPYWRTLVDYFLVEDRGEAVFSLAQPCAKDYDVRLQFGPIVKLQPRFGELFDRPAVAFQLYATVYDILAAANIDVIPPGLYKDLEYQPCVSEPRVDVEPFGFKAVHDLFVLFGKDLCGAVVHPGHEKIWERQIQSVCNLCGMRLVLPIGRCE